LRYCFNEFMIPRSILCLGKMHVVISDLLSFHYKGTYLSPY
jgi:hypothetical protein